MGRGLPFWSIAGRLAQKGRRDSAELKRARLLIEAVDRGGIPTIPGIVHSIARDLHLEVRSEDSIMTIIDKIRQTIR